MLDRLTKDANRIIFLNQSGYNLRTLYSRTFLTLSVVIVVHFETQFPGRLKEGRHECVRPQTADGEGTICATIL